jgi:hypothetical protein
MELPQEVDEGGVHIWRLFLPPGLYTERSFAIIKHWYDEKNPEVQFDVTDGRLVSVFIRGSNKQKYDLLKTDLGLSP